jgi:hypothetical protein
MSYKIRRNRKIALDFLTQISASIWKVGFSRKNQMAIILYAIYLNCFVIPLSQQEKEKPHF